MADEEFVRREIGDGVALYTQTITGPPYIYRYFIESTSFKKITFTFKFDGSENFELKDTEGSGPNNLQATVTVLPYARSSVVSIGQIDEQQGGSLSMAMSWLLEEPDADAAADYLAIYKAKMADMLKAANTLFPSTVVQVELEF
jgi:hypothetical protein